MEERKCLHCGGPLVRREKESTREFLRRRFCRVRCSSSELVYVGRAKKQQYANQIRTRGEFTPKLNGAAIRSRVAAAIERIQARKASR